MRSMIAHEEAAAAARAVAEAEASIPESKQSAGDGGSSIGENMEPVILLASFLCGVGIHLCYETRRNILKFEAGTLLYVRVVKANADMNPELSCTDANSYMFESSTGLSGMLLSSPTCPVLEALGKKLSFEIAVGLNCRVWVNALSPSTVILVAKAMMNSESLSVVQQKIMVDKLLQRIQ
ncbi:hypothetical protein AAG906_034506 [Vitis piasezkii]